jgi:hypothetical protein
MCSEPWATCRRPKSPQLVGNTENVSDHPTVDLPKGDVEKLDAVIVQLARAKIVATRSYLVRAVLRAAPAGKNLAPAVTKFLEDFPNKPRGLSKIRLARIARSNCGAAGARALPEE